MSFDTAWFQARGFDETLGPGTLSRGGEDIDAPIRVLLSGGQCVFEPAAIGWHADRYDDRSFKVKKGPGAEPVLDSRFVKLGGKAATDLVGVLNPAKGEALIAYGWAMAEQLADGL